MMLMMYKEVELTLYSAVLVVSSDVHTHTQAARKEGKGSQVELCSSILNSACQKFMRQYVMLQEIAFTY